MIGFRTLLSLLLVPVIAGCAGSAHTPSPMAKTELAPTGTLRVAVFTGNPVLGSRDEASGAVTGTTAQLGRALAARAGVPVSVTEYTAIAKMVEDAKAGV
jgi:polar amino acid transport system substrate-binding protein